MRAGTLAGAEQTFPIPTRRILCTVSAYASSTSGGGNFGGGGAG